MLKGASAYEVAVGQGFEGTAAEWLAGLKGAAGRTPQKGEDYFTGEDVAQIAEAAAARVPAPDVSGPISAHNASGTAHEDIREAIEATADRFGDYYDKMQIDAQVGNKVDAIPGKGLSSNDFTDADKAEIALVQELAERALEADRRRYIRAGAQFSPATGMYSLNGVEGISESEMDCIYRASADWGGVRRSRFYGYSEYRTFFPAYGSTSAYGSDWTAIFQYCDKLEAISVRQYYNGVEIRDIISPIDTGYMFHRCGKLRVIDGVINLSQVTGSIVTAFGFCGALETVLLKTLKGNLTLSASPVLATASVLYLIQNAAPASAVTVTLHAACYTRVMADAQVQAALAAQPLVALASA